LTRTVGVGSFRVGASKGSMPPVCLIVSLLTAHMLVRDVVLLWMAPRVGLTAHPPLASWWSCLAAWPLCPWTSSCACAQGKWCVLACCAPSSSVHATCVHVCVERGHLCGLYRLPGGVVQRRTATHCWLGIRQASPHPNSFPTPMRPSLSHPCSDPHHLPIPCPSWLLHDAA
jgi:hypothetical protein